MRADRAAAGAESAKLASALKLKESAARRVKCVVIAVQVAANKSKIVV